MSMGAFMSMRLLLPSSWSLTIRTLCCVCSEKTSSALFFKYNTQLGPPYQVLIDTNFINFSIKNKVLPTFGCVHRCAISISLTKGVRRSTLSKA